MNHTVVANSLVQEHQGNTKQIKQIRQREKEKMNERLREKLEKKIQSVSQTTIRIAPIYNIIIHGVN